MEDKENLPVSIDTNLPAAADDISQADIEALNKESIKIINSITAEQDPGKQKDLTYMFNTNQNKKTMIRINKLGELLDTMADQALTRFTKKPDEISNQELIQGMKVVQDIIERGSKQVSGVNDAPLIQINQQNNELNVGNDPAALPKESRDKVKNAVMSLLAGIENSTKVMPADSEFAEINKDEDAENGN